MRVSRLRLRVRTHHTQSRSAPLPSLISNRRQRAAEVVAHAFCDGIWSPDAMARRAAHDLAIEPDAWLERLARALVEAFPEPPSFRNGRFREAIEAELADPRTERTSELDEWLDGWNDEFERRWPRLARLEEPAAMAAQPWDVPHLDTPTALADFLRVDPRHLEWYADVRSLERSAADENLRHYDYHWRTKRRGGARLVEAPKQNLKYLQRRVLRDILDDIPAHDSAHGFRAGRSIQTFAAPHTGRRLVIRMDLRSFFTSVPVGRVFATFRAAGYPDAVAHALTGLATNATPPWVLRSCPNGAVDGATAAMLRGPHLPQGAPTSPALANLAAFALDVRLTALARRFDATYTRYADDLAVSGDDEFAASGGRFMAIAREIVHDEGFAIHPAKTRWQRTHQRQVLTGLTVNRHLNIDRADYDRLRAQLHEAIHHGPASANRQGHPNFKAHLEGRIGHVQATNIVRARKLWLMFDRISW